MNIQRLKQKWCLQALLGVCTLVWMCADQVASAAKKDKEEEAEVNYVVTPPVFKRLSKSHTLIGEGKYQEATELLDAIKDRRRLNDHERALIWQTFGYIYSSQEKYKQAIAAFQKCLDFKALPAGSAHDTQFNLGQLYLTTKEYKKAVNTLVDWLNKVENPSPSAKYMVAMAFVQTKNYNKALPLAKQAVNATPKPKEAWLQLLLAIHFEKKQYKNVAEDLEKLINLYPKKRYWMQLSQIYLEMKQQKKALMVMELAYVQNFLEKGSDLTNLAYLYLNENVPIKAAKVIEHGLKKGLIKKNVQNATLLADSYLRAKEFQQAIAPMTEAAKLSNDGNRYVRLAHVYIEMENWDDAIRSLKMSLKKGNLTDPGNAHLLLGISSYNNKKMDAAKKAFISAMKFGNTKNPAKQWLKLVSKKN